MANQLRLRNLAFEVDDLQAADDRLAADGAQASFVNCARGAG